MKRSIVEFDYAINRDHRENLNGHRSFLIWFTGLSGSGKSTIANALELKLFQLGIRTFNLDGDTLRSGLNKDLGFSEEDRSENIRRVAEIAKLLVNSGQVVLAAFISPLEKSREEVKSIVGRDEVVEVYVNTSLETCEKRDVKGLYKRARKGEILNFTGIQSPYEVPENPDLEIQTEREDVDEAVQKILDYINDRLKLKS